MAWPPRSPDFTPTGATLTDSGKELLARIEAAATIRQQPGISFSTHVSLLRLRRLCIEVGDLSFEHPL